MNPARQELDLRPQRERLDRLILRSAGLDPATLTFEFRPLWQMDAASKAAVALQKAQTTQIYAGLELWPTEVTGRLVQAQLAEDGTYPGAEGIFAADESEDLRLRPSPPGVTFTVTGTNTKELGESYSEQVREFHKGVTVPTSNTRGSSNPDGMITADTPQGRVTIEAKYIGDWAESIYNPDLRRPFGHNAVQKTVNQAIKYAEAYPAGVEWVTNSLDFVRAYSKQFSEAGVKNFHFTIIPAVRG